MNKAKNTISAKDIDAWTRRLETEWTCAQFASGLQVTPELASEILKKNGEVSDPSSSSKQTRKLNSSNS